MTLARLGDMVQKVRSKNAGPFWLTIDIFCGDSKAFEQVADLLTTGQVAQLFDVPTQAIKRFDIADLNVVKFSLPRPSIQGSRQDRDIHGASWAALLAEFEMHSVD
jgi:hypothetical protein